MYARFDRDGVLHHRDAYLAKGMPNEALRYLSKTLAITNAGDRMPWFRGLSDTNAKAGRGRQGQGV